MLSLYFLSLKNFCTSLMYFQIFARFSGPKSSKKP